MKYVKIFDMFDIKGYADGLNLYKRVYEGQMTLQTALGNILLSGLIGVTAAEFTQNRVAHNQGISSVAGALAMTLWFRRLETFPAGGYIATAETQPDLALVADPSKAESTYSQAA